MPSPWDNTTERKLLLCMIDPKATPRWQFIAQTMGPHFSAEACRYVLILLVNYKMFAYNYFSLPPASCFALSPFSYELPHNFRTCLNLVLALPNPFKTCLINGLQSVNAKCYCWLFPLPISDLLLRLGHKLLLILVKV